MERKKINVYVMIGLPGAGKLERLLWGSGTLSSIIECRANEILNNRLNNNR